MMDTYNVENTFVFRNTTTPTFGDDHGEGSLLFSELDSYLTSASSCSVLSSSADVQGALKDIEAFENHDVMNWDGQACLSWAINVCRNQRIDPHTVNLAFFSSVTGRELSCYSRFDFSTHLDTYYGAVFYDEFHQLLLDMGLVSSTPTYVYEGSLSPYSDDGSSSGGEVSDDPTSMNLWELPPLSMNEDFSDLDQYIHQHGSWEPLQTETEQYTTQGLVGIEGEFSSTAYAPSVPHVRAEEPIMMTDHRPSNTASSLDAVVPSCSALRKIRTKSRKRQRGPKNWEFVIRLLADKEYNPAIIKWEDRATNTFRFVKPAVVAMLWGQRSDRPNLSYDNFARGLRYHYTTGALRPVSEKQLVYQCGPKALKFLNDLLQENW